MTTQGDTGKKLVIGSASRTLVAVARLAAAFFLVPYTVRNLGDDWYGLWVLASGLTGLYYFADLGIGTAVQRFFTEHLTRREIAKANEVVNTSLFIYLFIALGLVLVSVCVAWFSYVFVRDPARYAVFRWVVLFLGITLAIEIPFNAFSGIIMAYLRYDILSISHIAVIAANTLLTVVVLERGGGILALTAVSVGCSVASCVGYWLVSRHLFKELELSRRHVSKQRARDLMNYGVWALVIQAGDMLRFRIDTIVIGARMGARDITHYSVGSNFSNHFLNLQTRALNLLTPVFTRYHVLEERVELRTKFLFMQKISTAMAVFGGGVIILVGKPLIHRWMGEAYLDGYPVLVVLVAAMIVEVVSIPAKNVLFAISKHRYLALNNLAEGALNLAISLALLPRYGILGVAIGTLVPIVVFKGLLVPAYVCRQIGLGTGRYVSATLLPAACLAAYLYLYRALCGNYIAVPTYPNIALAGLFSVPLFLVICHLVVFNREEKTAFLSIVR